MASGGESSTSRSDARPVAPDVTIRAFDLERDYDAARALWERSGPGVRVSSRSDTRAEIARKLERDPELFLVAQARGQLVGTVIGGFDGRRGLVYHLAVDAARRRSGIGRALMAELERRLRAKGCRKYYLLVGPELDEAIAFYERCGLRSMPFLIMGKELDP